MNLLNFNEIYPNEESCRLRFKEMRDKQGVVCLHCGCKEHYWKGDKWVYEFKKMQFSYHSSERNGSAWLKTAIPILVYSNALIDIDQEEFFSQRDSTTALAHAI